MITLEVDLTDAAPECERTPVDLINRNQVSTMNAALAAYDAKNNS